MRSSNGLGHFGAPHVIFLSRLSTTHNTHSPVHSSFSAVAIPPFSFNGFNISSASNLAPTVLCVCTLFHRDFIFLQTKIHNNNRNNSRKTRAWFAFLSSNFTIVTVTENRRTQHEHTNNAKSHLPSVYERASETMTICLDSETMHALLCAEKENMISYYNFS